MPFCEDSLFHKRFNHARPAAAAAIWASEGTMSKSRFRQGRDRLKLSPRKARLCQPNVVSSSLSSMPRLTQASAQSGWPHQMAMSSKVTKADPASPWHLAPTNKHCKSSPASSAARILSRDSFLPPPGPRGPSKKNSPNRLNPLSKFLGLQRPWRPGSRWRISCQSSNFDFRNNACGKGTCSSEPKKKDFTMRSWKSAPAHKAVLAACQHSSKTQSIFHRRRGRSWHFLAKLTAASCLPVKMEMSSNRAIAFADPLNGTSMSRLQISSMARVTGVAAAFCAAGMAPKASSASSSESTRASSQSSIQMPSSTGKVQQQYSHVSQPWQWQKWPYPTGESLLNVPRWWSSKMQPSTPCIAIAQAVSMRPNHRQRSNRCTMPHWDGSNWLNSSWVWILGGGEKVEKPELKSNHHGHTVLIMKSIRKY